MQSLSVHNSGADCVDIHMQCVERSVLVYGLTVLVEKAHSTASHTREDNELLIRANEYVGPRLYLLFQTGDQFFLLLGKENGANRLRSPFTMSPQNRLLLKHWGC